MPPRPGSSLRTRATSRIWWCYAILAPTQTRTRRNSGSRTADSHHLLNGFTGEAAEITSDHGEKLAAEGEICWGGTHSWKKAVQLLEESPGPGGDVGETRSGVRY